MHTTYEYIPEACTQHCLLQNIACIGVDDDDGITQGEERGRGILLHHPKVNPISSSPISTRGFFLLSSSSSPFLLLFSPSTLPIAAGSIHPALSLPLHSSSDTFNPSPVQVRPASAAHNPVPSPQQQQRAKRGQRHW